MDIKVANGTLDVSAVAAEEQSASVDGRNEVWVEPAVRVAGTLAIRGVDYTVMIDYRYCRWERPVYEDGRETGETTRWEVDFKWDAHGRRVDTGKPAEFRTPTWKVINTNVKGALARYVVEHPGWERESQRLRLESLIAKEDSRIDDAEGVIREATAYRAALMEELAAT